MNVNLLDAAIGSRETVEVGRLIWSIRWSFNCKFDILIERFTQLEKQKLEHAYTFMVPGFASGALANEVVVFKQIAGTLGFR